MGVRRRSLRTQNRFVAGFGFRKGDFAGLPDALNGCGGDYDDAPTQANHGI